MEKNSRDADQAQIDKLVELASAFDDELVLEREKAFMELVRLSPDRAKSLAVEILGDPHRQVSGDAFNADTWRGFFEDHQALAFEALHAVSPIEAAKFVLDHAAAAPSEVLRAMLDQSSGDAALPDPRPLEIERAAAVLRDVVSRLPSHMSRQLADGIDLFKSRWNF